MSLSYGNMTLRERSSIDEKANSDTAQEPEPKRKRRSRRIENEKSMDSGDTSSQEPKKMPQIFKKADSRGKYDNMGIHKATQKDLCDCLTVECPGCFMACPRCGSHKCGHECRRNRKWVYESFEIEGTSLVMKNQFKR